MIGKFHLPISGGADPDPATYCPANGYIPNPLTVANGWNLLAEFDTNSPNSTTFDPSISANSGEYAWDLGDGNIAIGTKSIEHTYADGSTKTVKLYGKGTCNISTIDFSIDNIVGELDISNDAFKTLTQVYLQTNAALTDIILPATMTANMLAFHAYSTGITGTLDISSIVKFATSSIIQLHSNSALTGVTFATSLTTPGTISSINIYNCNLSGTINLSGFTNFTTSATIQLYGNTSLSGVTLASSISGTFSTIDFSGTGISGTLDLSKITAFTSAASIQLQNTPSMTGVTFASSITGTLIAFYMWNSGVTSLDLSKFTAWSSTASLSMYNCTALTSLTFPSSTITGYIRTLPLYGCTSLGYVDFTKLRTGVASLNWQFQNNGWSAATVNQVLVDIDGISGSGFTGRVINIGGTNADPDGTSGGYDGTAARNQLIADGFTVTIT